MYVNIMAESCKLHMLLKLVSKQYIDNKVLDKNGKLESISPGHHIIT